MNKKIILVAFLAPLALWIVALLCFFLADMINSVQINISFPGCYLGSVFLIINAYKVYKKIPPGKERVLPILSILFFLAGPFFIFLLVYAPYFKGQYTADMSFIPFSFYVLLILLLLTLIVIQILYMTKVIVEKKYFILINIFLGLNILLWPLHVIFYSIFVLGSL